MHRLRITSTSAAICNSFYQVFGSIARHKVNEDGDADLLVETSGFALRALLMDAHTCGPTRRYRYTGGTSPRYASTRTARGARIVKQAK